MNKTVSSAYTVHSETGASERGQVSGVKRGHLTQRNGRVKRGPKDHLPARVCS